MFTSDCYDVIMIDFISSSIWMFCLALAPYITELQLEHNRVFIHYVIYYMCKCIQKRTTIGEWQWQTIVFTLTPDLIRMQPTVSVSVKSENLNFQANWNLILLYDFSSITDRPYFTLFWEKFTLDWNDSWTGYRIVVYNKVPIVINQTPSLPGLAILQCSNKIFWKFLQGAQFEPKMKTSAFF